MHVFDEATVLEPLPGGGFGGRTHPAWANMVGPFGGITAACLLRAPMLHPARIGEPIGLTVNYAAAVADGAFEIVANPVRTNRSTQHWTIELRQAGAVAMTGSAVFAVRRQTWSGPGAEPPADPPPAVGLPRAEQARLAWTRNLDMRFVAGGLPATFDGTEQRDATTTVWLRDDPPRPLDLPALASLCDSFFPRVMLRRHRLVPIGTVSMTTWFHADAALLAAQGDRHVLGVARPGAFRNGYFDQSAEIWSDRDELLATSHQIVYYRE